MLSCLLVVGYYFSCRFNVLVSFCHCDLVCVFMTFCCLVCVVVVIFYCCCDVCCYVLHPLTSK